MSVVPTSRADGRGNVGLVAEPCTLPGLGRDPIYANLVDTGFPEGVKPRSVVFLHGLVGLNEHWDEVVGRVRHRLRCVMLELPLLELRGDDCSIDGVTEIASRFLRDRVGGASVLVGNSFGGHVALRVALHQPALVSGLVLAGSSGLIERSIVSDIQIKPSREWLVRKIGELFYDPDRHMRDADIDRAHRALTDRGGARAMVRLSKSARRNHLGDQISLIQAPTLLIWGRQDIVTPPEAAEQFLTGLPQSRIVWLDDCGHAPMIEKPDDFARALLEFADELDRRDARRAPGGRTT